MWGGLGWGFLFYLSIFNMEDFGVVIGFEYFCQVLTVGVGNEDLTEIVSLYHLHNPLHTFAVQTVEDVI